MGCSAVVSSSSLTRTRASPVIIVSVSFRPSAQLGCLLLPGELILRPFLNPMRASHPLVLHVPHPTHSNRAQRAIVLLRQTVEEHPEHGPAHGQLGLSTLFYNTAAKEHPVAAEHLRQYVR